jgi:hypothetical protein
LLNLHTDEPLEISPRDLLGFQYSDEGAISLVMASPHGRDTGFADFAMPPMNSGRWALPPE